MTQIVQRVTFAERVAGNVRAESARRGLTAADLSRLTGMSQSAISLRWTGSRQWQLEDLERVAAALGLTPEALCREYAARESNPQPADMGLRPSWVLAA